MFSDVLTIKEAFLEYKDVKVGFSCPRRDFVQKAKSRRGTLVTCAYIKESTYS